MNFAIISTVRAHSWSNLFPIYILFRLITRHRQRNKQTTIKIWNVLPRVDIRLKKGHEITARTVFFGPYSKDDFRWITEQPTLAAEYETSSMIFLLNQNKLLWTHQYHRCWFLLVFLLNWIEAKASPNLTNNTNISKKNASAKKQTFVHALAEHFPSRSHVFLPLTKSHRTREDERNSFNFNFFRWTSNEVW